MLALILRLVTFAFVSPLLARKGKGKEKSGNGKGKPEAKDICIDCPNGKNRKKCQGCRYNNS